MNYKASQPLRFHLYGRVKPSRQEQLMVGHPNLFVTIFDRVVKETVDDDGRPRGMARVRHVNFSSAPFLTLCSEALCRAASSQYYN
jgi:hypothetical protein